MKKFIRIKIFLYLWINITNQYNKFINTNILYVWIIIFVFLSPKRLFNSEFFINTKQVIEFCTIKNKLTVKFLDQIIS